MDSKKISIKTVVILIIAAILFVAAAAAITVGVRLNSLRGGMAMELSYEIRPLHDTAKLHTMIDGLGMADGTATGKYDGQALALQIYPADAKDAVTDIYMGREGNYINARKLYGHVMGLFAARYPALSKMMPEWSMGDYLPLDQLASVTGRRTWYPADRAAMSVATSSGVQRIVGLSSLLKNMERVSYDQGKPGYIYFRGMYRGMELTAGVEPLSLFQKKIRVHLVAEDVTRGLRFAVEGGISSSAEPVAAPESVMSKEQIAELGDMIGLLSDLGSLRTE